MWRVAVVVGLLVGFVHVAFGDEVAILNDPPAAVSVARTVIEKLDPSYETFWNLGAGELQQGISASLYGFTSNEIHIASARLGYATNETLYGGVSLDLPGLSQRFVPASVKGIATITPLNTLWAVVGKYARVGIVGGYSWAENEPAYGLTAGAALSF